MADSNRDEAIKRGKAKADKKAKERKAKAKQKAAGPPTSIAGHPRAAQAVRRAKGIGALAGFALAALASHGAGVSHTQMAERALAGGVVAYLLAWACAVTVWRHIVLAELRALAEQRFGFDPVKGSPPTRSDIGGGSSGPAAEGEPSSAGASAGR